MVNWHRWSITGVFGCALSALIYAHGLGVVEVYAKVKPSPDACKTALKAFAGHTDQPNCKVIHAASSKVRLRWLSATHQLAAAWLDADTAQAVIEWYEFNTGGLHTNSLGVAGNTFGDISRFNTLRPTADSLAPWFVTEATKKLATAVQVHDAYHPIVVAIIDSGVNFEGSLADVPKWTNPRELGGDGLDNDANGYADDVHGWDFVETGVSSIFDDTTTPDNNPADRLGHGTAVAAIVAKTVGDAFSPYLRIMPLRVASGAGGGGSVEPAALAEAIYYATDNGADIINISLAGNQYYKLIEDALFYAMGRGVKVVAAAGNTGGAVMFPASVPGVLAVGAADSRGGVWSGSATGSAVDLYAPGVNMLTELGVNTFYLSQDGTSFAAPVVTGVLAMLTSFGQGNGCTVAVGGFFKQLPPSKLMGDWLGGHATKVESVILSGRDMQSQWNQNTLICGANEVTVNALMR